MNSDSLLIEGLTEEGRRFRPSDWVERLASLGATFGSDNRLHFSPLLRPIAVEGSKALAVGLCLQKENPALWRQVLDFARTNSLRVRGPVHTSDEELAIAC